MFGHIQKRGGAKDVGLQKRKRVGDAAVHVAFRSQVENGVEAVRFEKGLQCRGVPDVALDKRVARVVFHVPEVGQVPSVREGVKVDHMGGRLRAQQPTDDMRSDESSPTRDENGVELPG